jgi:hypothetical protein
MSITAAIIWVAVGFVAYFAYRLRYILLYLCWSLTKEGRKAKALRESAEKRDARKVHFYKPEEIWGKEERKSA